MVNPYQFSTMSFTLKSSPDSYDNATFSLSILTKFGCGKPFANKLLFMHDKLF